MGAKHLLAGCAHWPGAVIGFASVLLQSQHERSRPAGTQRRLISTLFGRASNVFMVAIAAVICGAAALIREGSSSSAIIAAIEVTLLAARCALILAFKWRERAASVADANLWLVGFGVLAVASSLCWGALCFVALATSRDPLLYVIPVLATVGTAGAVAARNSGVPRLAKAQLACSLVPICLGCFLPADHGFRLLVLLVPAMAAGLVILIGERNQQLVDLIETQIELARLSQTDALTQLPNRRALDLAMEETAASTLALLMVDVDRFKAFNDRHGHLIGDVLLRNIAEVLRESLTDERDVVARYGGEEFAILLHDATLVEAVEAGERLRTAVRLACKAPSDGAAVTISVGCAVAQAGEGPRTTMRRADEALYAAKRAGRDCLRWAHASASDLRLASQFLGEAA